MDIQIGKRFLNFFKAKNDEGKFWDVMTNHIPGEIKKGGLFISYDSYDMNQNQIGSYGTLRSRFW